MAQAFNIGFIHLGLVETLIVRIPKVDQPKCLKEFRPISLCNVLSKTILKVLVHKVRPLLDELISPLQSVFISGQGTSNNALITKEIVHHMCKKMSREGYLLFKIDFEKDYDRIDWPPSK